MHNNWPMGDDLTAAARRGDLIREMLRERGYVTPVQMIEDILASVAAEVRHEEIFDNPRRPGVTVHRGSAKEVADDALAAVEQMLVEAK